MSSYTEQNGIKVSGHSSLKEKIAVGVLGATGVVGQQFIRFLSHHPYFELTVLGASDRSEGKLYGNIVAWKLGTPLPVDIAQKTVVNANDVEKFKAAGCRAIFSALDASVAGEIELNFARQGFAVFSNARNHRYDNTIPILVPYANASHLDIITEQQQRHSFPSTGYIVTNANCSSTGLAVALKPLLDRYGIDSVFVVTMQAISGAGYPGVASLDIMDNIYPYISGEEPKMELEPRKMLGTLDPSRRGDGEEGSAFVYADFKLSATCNRVPVIDGHTECVSVKLRRPPASLNSSSGDDTAFVKEINELLSNYTSEAQQLQLPSASKKPITVYQVDNRPQPRLDRDLENGMAVSVGRVRRCPLFDVKFTLVSHNTVIGAAGGSILNAELAYAKGKL